MTRNVLCRHCDDIRDESPGRPGWCATCAPPPHEADRLRAEVEHRHKLAREIADLAAPTVGADALDCLTKRPTRWVTRPRWRVPHLAVAGSPTSVCNLVTVVGSTPASAGRRGCKFCARIVGLIRDIVEDPRT